MNGARIALLALLPAVAIAAAPDAEAVWKEFTNKLRAGALLKDDLRPYYPQLRDPMFDVLQAIRRDARPTDWTAKPELHVVGNQIHGIISLTGSDGQKWPYCFSLLIEDSRWYFQHVESIFIRLDQLGPLPASRFPDLSDAKKSWMRDERRVTEQVKVFNLISKEKSREEAFRFLQDGAGYALEARTWVPFVPPPRAFVLYLCWEQANLMGNPVTLQSLEDTAAKVRLQPRWFKLYKQTGHLRLLIPEADYRELFEKIWQSRAQAAGWKLQIEYSGDESIFRFAR